ALMVDSPDILALKQARSLCLGHQEALQDALQDMEQRAMNVSEHGHLTKADRRLLDQFAYRYTRLQDDMGARLIPSVLRALGEEVAAMPALDRFIRLEQLGWLPSADEWMSLRQIRNQFAHDYPDTPEERFERLQAAMRAAWRMMDILQQINRILQQRFGEM
ncbi:MAG: hypothetical protein PHE55_09165, partial [Methylococcaceae bacterium]|nr:hypothetical protein [Methylococcaceae bacterium]